jgi:hypothetical protein
MCAGNTDRADDIDCSAEQMVDKANDHTIALPTGTGSTCTGTLSPLNGTATDCAAAPAFLASGLESDCPTGDGCSWTAPVAASPADISAACCDYEVCAEDLCRAETGKMPKADQSALTSLLAVTVETCCDDTSGMCAGNADAFAGGELRSLDGLYAFACGSGYALKDDAYHIALGALADQRASRCCTAVPVCTPKTDAEWAAMGYTIERSTGVTVVELGSVSCASGYMLQQSDVPAQAICAGGTLDAAGTQSCAILTEAPGTCAMLRSAIHDRAPGLYFTISDECFLANDLDSTQTHIDVVVTVQRCGSNVFAGLVRIWHTNSDEPEDSTRSMGRKETGADEGDWEDGDVMFFQAAPALASFPIGIPGTFVATGCTVATACSALADSGAYLEAAWEALGYTVESPLAHTTSAALGAVGCAQHTHSSAQFVLTGCDTEAVESLDLAPVVPMGQHGVRINHAISNGFIEKTMPDIDGTASIRYGTAAPRANWTGVLLPAQVIVDSVVVSETTEPDTIASVSFTAGQTIRVRKQNGALHLWHFKTTGGPDCAAAYAAARRQAVSYSFAVATRSELEFLLTKDGFSYSFDDFGYAQIADDEYPVIPAGAINIKSGYVGPTSNLWGTNNPGAGGVCEAECDDDSECTGDLLCWQRDSTLVSVPGCEESAASATNPAHWDYCYDPSVTSMAFIEIALPPDYAGVVMVRYGNAYTFAESQILVDDVVISTTNAPDVNVSVPFTGNQIMRIRELSGSLNLFSLIIPGRGLADAPSDCPAGCTYIGESAELPGNDTETCCVNITGQCAGNADGSVFDCSPTIQKLSDKASTIFGNDSVACCVNITGQCAGNSDGSAFNCTPFMRALKPTATAIADDGLAQTCCDRLPCPAPGVTINTEAPLTIRPSTDAYVDAIGFLPICEVPANASLQFEWSCSDPSIVLDPLTRSTNKLWLPPFMLSAADNITLTVSASLSSASNLTTTASIVVLCVATPEIFAVIAGGSSLMIYPGADLIIDGTGSSDPDSPDVVWDTVQWSCIDVTDAAAPASCFQGAVLPSTPGLVWDLSDLVLHSASYAPCDLRISLALSESGRHDTATLRVKIADAPVPTVSVLDTQPKYSASSRIVFEGLAVPVSPRWSTFSWEWTAFRVSQVDQVVDLPLEPISSTPITNPSLVIRPGSLEVGASYRFRLSVFDGRTTGEVEVDVLVNSPPSGGNVTVVPTEGMAISDRFLITAQGWNDPDIPLMYAFSYQESLTGDARSYGLMSQGLSPVADVVLPVTARWLIASVVDSYSAAAQGFTRVTVSPYAPAVGFSIQTDAADMISSGLTNGNAQETTQLVSAFAGALGGDSASMSEDGLEEARETRELLANALATLSENAAEAPAGQLEMMAQGAAAVASDAAQLTPAAMSNAVGAVASMGSAKAMNGKVTPPKVSSGSQLTRFAHIGVFAGTSTLVCFVVAGWVVYL